jgi:hypothetical protein
MFGTLGTEICNDMDFYGSLTRASIPQFYPQNPFLKNFELSIIYPDLDLNNSPLWLFLKR